MTQYERTRYESFKQFVSVIDDCSEEGLTADEIRNRLDWGWHYLAQFAKLMGQPYEQRVFCCCDECAEDRQPVERVH